MVSQVGHYADHDFTAHARHSWTPRSGFVQRPLRTNSWVRAGEGIQLGRTAGKCATCPARVKLRRRLIARPFELDLIFMCFEGEFTRPNIQCPLASGSLAWFTYVNSCRHYVLFVD